MGRCRTDRLLLAIAGVVLASCTGGHDGEVVDSGTEGDTAAQDSTLPSLGDLGSGTFTLTQSWSQETDYPRTIHVEVPEGDGPFPAVVLLHGNGGQGPGMLAAHAYLTGAILVAPDGYERSWNIAAEVSKAPDVALVQGVLDHLTRHDNVDASDISVLGISNGSALTNRLFIELDSPALRRAVTVVSPLQALQFHDGSFFGDPANDGSWDAAFVPSPGRRLLNVSGTDDPLVPYAGGTGVAGYTFLPAEESTWRWAAAMGYAGVQLTSVDGVADAQDPNVIAYAYDGVGVTHLQVVGGGHDAGNLPAVRDQIAAFLMP